MNKLRYLPAFLILLNMAFIFFNSAAPAEASNGASMKVARAVAAITVPGYREMPEPEKTRAAKSVNSVVRECAHGLEFASLGFLTMLYLRTGRQPDKRGFTRWKNLILAVLFCMLYAVSDEVHQLFSAGRVCDAMDVAVDTSGAFLGALAAMLPFRGKTGVGDLS